jgi:hypothetical protein
MRKLRRQPAARAKTNGRRGRGHAEARSSREGISAAMQTLQARDRGSRAARSGPVADPTRIAAPWNAVAGELYSFSSRRLNRVMRASSRCVAARSLDEVAEVQSQFMLDLLKDYVDETSRVISACVRALEQNVDTLYSAGEAIGTRMSGNGARAIAPMMRDPFAAARTATVVQ